MKINICLFFYFEAYNNHYMIAVRLAGSEKLVFEMPLHIQ